MGAFAADKHAPKAKASKASQVVEVNEDGPVLKSSGVLVLDPATGHTLYSKNADQATPIASITKLMTAMVVLDAKLSEAPSDLAGSRANGEQPRPASCGTRPARGADFQGACYRGPSPAR